MPITRMPQETLRSSLQVQSFQRTLGAGVLAVMVGSANLRTHSGFESSDLKAVSAGLWLTHDLSRPGRSGVVSTSSEAPRPNIFVVRFEVKRANRLHCRTLLRVLSCQLDHNDSKNRMCLFLLMMVIHPVLGRPSSQH
jgi:hypothetical protein